MTSSKTSVCASILNLSMTPEVFFYILVTHIQSPLTAVLMLLEYRKESVTAVKGEDLKYCFKRVLNGLAKTLLNTV